MSSIKLEYQLVFFSKSTYTEKNKGALDHKSKLFDFGSNYAYFLVLSEYNKSLRGWLNTLHNTLEGSYCLIRIANDESRPFFIGLSMEWLCSQVGYFSDLEQYIYQVLTSWSDKHSLFSISFLAFLKEYQRTLHKDLLTKSFFLHILSSLLNDIQIVISRKKEKNFKESDFQKIREIEEKISQSIYKSASPVPSINEMAKIAGMSVSKFKSLFYELFGTSPHQYILDKKLIFAKGLLQTGEYSITQVAYKIGYHHPSSFTRVYKQKFNHSPNTTYLEKQ